LARLTNRSHHESGRLFGCGGEVRSPDSKGIASSLTRRHTMKGNGTEAKTPQRGKNPTSIFTFLPPCVNKMHNIPLSPIPRLGF